jgi:hypothetical protein
MLTGIKWSEVRTHNRQNAIPFALSRSCCGFSFFLFFIGIASQHKPREDASFSVVGCPNLRLRHGQLRANLSATLKLGSGCGQTGSGQYPEAHQQTKERHRNNGGKPVSHPTSIIRNFPDLQIFYVE